MRRYNKCQTDQGEVLDNYCYVIFILMTFVSIVMLLQLLAFLNTNSAKCESCLVKGNLEKL